MKKTLLAAVALAATFPLFANAATLKFPSEAPVASVTIPDSWGPKETESGVDATSADSAIYFSIDVADGKNMEKVINDAIDFLGKSGVTIDTASKKESPDTTINGMPMSSIDWSGKDEDGAVDISLGLVQPSADKLLVLTYWGSKADEKKHADELVAIFNSLKPAK